MNTYTHKLKKKKTRKKCTLDKWLMQNQTNRETKEYIHKNTYTHTQNQNSPKETKYRRVIHRAKESKNDINQIKIKLTKTQNRKQDQSSKPNEK